MTTHYPKRERGPEGTNPARHAHSGHNLRRSTPRGQKIIIIHSPAMRRGQRDIRNKKDTMEHQETTLQKTSRWQPINKLQRVQQQPNTSVQLLRELPPHRTERKDHNLQSMGETMRQLRQTKSLQKSMQTTGTTQPDATTTQQQRYGRPTTSQRYRSSRRGLLGSKRIRTIPRRITIVVTGHTQHYVEIHTSHRM